MLRHASRWALVLFIAWAVLALRIGVALARRESFADDLALPAVAFIVTSALLGSRVWQWLARPRATGDETTEARAGSE